MSFRFALSILAAASAAAPMPAQSLKPSQTEDAEWNQWLGPNRDGMSPDKGLSSPLFAAGGQA